MAEVMTTPQWDTLQIKLCLYRLLPSRLNEFSNLQGYPYTLMLVGLVGSSLTYLLLGPSPVLLPMVGPEK